ncbi:organic cation transporter protein-like [Amyelois transitella]|uniref:organic cation transporter protein-like n=1 Tax=Amyelois transitella TaxID=680683 RepID=UPI00298FB4CD|nr:organic cation transporter protein-like [Amyelois transitella]
MAEESDRRASFMSPEPDIVEIKESVDHSVRTDRRASFISPDASNRKVSIAEENLDNGSNRKGSIAPNASRKGSHPRKGSVFEKPIDLDDVLINELGQFGRYQFHSLLLVAIPIIMSAFMSEYIFSAAAIPHRCLIPECGETTENAVYDNPITAGAYPEGESCERYVPLGNGTLNFCPSLLFHPNTTIECDTYVYDRTNSVVYEFDLGCTDWLRVLAGTLNSVGTLLVLPITGYISDRFGRRVALIISVFNLGLIGLIRAFSVNYPMYLALQLLQTTLGAGTFSSSYIILTELVGPKYRVVTSATCSSMFAVGQVVMGAVAWAVQPWRYFIMTLHIPCFLIVSYYWFLNESVRWLLSKEKYTEARTVLEKVARVNKKQISEKSMQALMNPPTLPLPADDGNSPGLISTIVHSRVLLRRVCTTPIWWITTTFVYYGLSINSTSLSSTNMYLNYILTCAIEIPGFYTAVLVLDRIGRKATLSSGFFLSAACNIAFSFIPEDLSILSLCVFLLGKFGISVVFTSLYLFTSELYPTQFRHTLLAFSSMIGRIGSITAPLTPQLAEYWGGIPTMMFGVMGLISGLLVLTQPETLGTRMPDTLAEAEAIGKPESKIKRTT